MTSLAPPEFALPPLAALKFLPFLFLQCLLLHPAFPDAISRPLRLILMVPAIYFSASAPFIARMEPAHLAIGANFRLGIFGPELILKSLEWGLAVDRKPYQWIGFDGMGKDSEARSPTASPRARHDAGEAKAPLVSKLVEEDVGEHGRPAIVKVEHSISASERDGPWRIFGSTVHLLGAMRGIGFAFGPPAHSLAPSPPRSSLGFLQFTLSSLLKAHLVNCISISIIINRDTAVPRLLQTYFFPFLPLTALHTLAHLIAYFLVGISLWSQMILGQSGASLAFFFGIGLLRVLLPASLRPAPFDSREWPALFNNPSVPRSVTHFWSGQWHHLFRKPFTFVGYDPAVAVLTPFAGKSVARMAGALVVFLLSGWLHDQGLWSARHGLTPPPDLQPLSFIERWGAWIFFVSQAVAVALEGLFAKTTGKRFAGRLATAWAYCWIVGVGLLAGRSWIALGLVRDLPPVQAWSWQRFVVPSGVLAPPPLWTK